MTVSGLLAQTGSQDDQLLFATLSTAQTVLGKPDQVSMVEVAALCNACPLVDDLNVYALRNEQQADFRREYLGFVFQSFHLVPYLTVIENIMLPLTAINISKRKKKYGHGSTSMGGFGGQRQTTAHSNFWR